MLNTPNIRLKGFTGPWELRKFGDIAQRQSETMVSDDDNPCVEYEDVISERGALNKDIYLKNVYKIGVKFSKEDILYGKLRPYLHNWLNPDFMGVAVGDWWVLRPINIDKNFLYRLIQTSRYDAAANQSSGTKMPRADWKLISNLEFQVPSSIDEQSQIASIFDNIDTLITLHQRKCYEMSKLKKSMLQKMFPKNGERFPEIRFKGFTDSWEQCMLGELVERYEDPVETPHDGYERLGIRSHAKGTFHSYVDAGKELEAAKMHRVAADKFIVNITFAWEHAVAITNDEDAGLFVSHRFPQFSFREDLKSHFFKYVMIDKKFREHLELSSPGGAGRNRVLKIDDMLKYNIRLPSIEEQTKIGEYFDNLDTLITLYQHRCEELKNIKKYMLQNMFPTKG